MNDGEKKEVAMELSVPQAEEEETVNKQSTTILEQVRPPQKKSPFFHTLSYVIYFMLL